ncbi:MAG TPA: cytochrome c maturation protein CcmE [Thermoanaerobaculia bacterium]|jgi:cytochrome c-type biogenesis protein CcmE|nr:cytochrome c maturation protein CcmE [Thermoanaerobaculia bacterium]
MDKDLKRRRVITLAAIAVVAGVIAFVAYGNIGGNLVYYWSPKEVHAAGHKAVGASIRLGGLVAPGSIERASTGLDLRFTVTDGDSTVPVHASAVPPAMFREGIGVVVEGTMRQDGVFESRRLMVKHDNEYRAPGDGDNRDIRELMRSLDPEAAGGATGG